MLQGAFHLFAALYDRLTANRLWQESIGEMARHLPPSGATLRLVDVGGGPANSAHALHLLRPDLRIASVDISAGMLRAARRRINQPGLNKAIQLVRADGLQLPFAANSVDAITAHGLYYLIAAPNKARFLAEAKRVLRPGGRLILLDPAASRFPFDVIRQAPLSAPSVLLWQLGSRADQRVSPESMGQALDAAGFSRVFGEKALAGYGVLSRGEKMDQASPLSASGGKPVRRSEAVGMKTRTANDTLTEVHGSAFLALPGPFIFLLIRQTPDQPTWKLPPGTPISWKAVCALEINGDKTVVLAFSSLPKAVAFMQPAVISERILGVSHIAKFNKSIAARWPFGALLNPSLALLASTNEIPSGASYRLLTEGLTIDPDAAVSGDE